MKSDMALLWILRVVSATIGVIICIVGIVTFFFGIPLLIVGIIPGIITMIFGWAIMIIGALFLSAAGIPTIKEKIGIDAIKRIKEEAKQKKDDEHEVKVQEEIDRINKETPNGL